jgi:hypothetical protein
MPAAPRVERGGAGRFAKAYDLIANWHPPNPKSEQIENTESQISSQAALFE